MEGARLLHHNEGGLECFGFQFRFLCSAVWLVVNKCSVWLVVRKVKMAVFLVVFCGDLPVEEILQSDCWKSNVSSAQPNIVLLGPPPRVRRWWEQKLITMPHSTPPKPTPSQKMKQRAYQLFVLWHFISSFMVELRVQIDGQNEITNNNNLSSRHWKGMKNKEDQSEQKISCPQFNSIGFPCSASQRYNSILSWRIISSRTSVLLCFILLEIHCFCLLLCKILAINFSTLQ